MNVHWKAFGVVGWLVVAAAGWAVVAHWAVRVYRVESVYESTYFERLKMSKSVPAYMPGRVVKWNDNGGFLFARWSRPERTHRWSASRRCGLLFRLPADHDCSAPHEFRLRTVFTAGPQRVRVVANGRDLGQQTVSGAATLRVSIPAGTLRAGEVNVIELGLPDARNTPTDSRLMALALRDVLVRLMPGWDPATGRFGSACSLVYYDETDGRVQMDVWQGGPKAVLNASLPLARVNQRGWSLATAAASADGSTVYTVWLNQASRQVTLHDVDPEMGQRRTWRWLSRTGRPGWRPAALADIDGDGALDLLWQQDGTRRIDADLRAAVPGRGAPRRIWLDQAGRVGWTLAAAADLDGDRRADLICQNDGTHTLAVAYTRNAPHSGLTWELLKRVPVARARLIGAIDFDGDGAPDTIWDDGKNLTVDFSGPLTGVPAKSITIPHPKTAGWQAAFAGWRN